MGDNYVTEMTEMLSKIKDKKILKRLYGIIELQVEKEQEESNIAV